MSSGLCISYHPYTPSYCVSFCIVVAAAFSVPAPAWICLAKHAGASQDTAVYPVVEFQTLNLNFHVITHAKVRSVSGSIRASLTSAPSRDKAQRITELPNELSALCPASQPSCTQSSSSLPADQGVACGARCIV